MAENRTRAWAEFDRLRSRNSLNAADHRYPGSCHRAHASQDVACCTCAGATRAPPGSPGQAYWLILLGAPQATVGVAAIDTSTGDPMIGVSLPGTAGHLQMGEAAALESAQLSPARGALVWTSCTASRSPVYPLWQVSDGRRTTYVDQNGRLWDRLEDDDRGG